MDTSRLASILQRPALHQRLLGDYTGAYSLGIGRDPDNPSAPAIILQVENDPPLPTPDYIQIDNESVRVIKKTKFVAPKPLSL